MLTGGIVKQIYELHGEGRSIREISTRLGLSRNTVRKYLRHPEVPKAKPRPVGSSKLDPYAGYIQQRLADGIDNCVVLLRELQQQGYTGGYTILKDYVQPRRRRRQPSPTVRFETEPGAQAQVDFGRFRYERPDGSMQYLWVFVLVLSWSRALYVECIQRADVFSFIRCHVHAFTQLGGVPARCLYDNAKVVVLGRDAAGQPRWNEQFLDFSLRAGFGLQLCRPYRPQTKGRVESGVKYVEGNFWPSVRFTDLDDLNRQAASWCAGIANQRLHGTTGERPADRLMRERPLLLPLPPAERLSPFLREPRTVGRDGFVQWNGSWYGVPWHWVGKTVQVASSGATVELWAGEERIAVHPRALHPRQRLVAPGQWDGLPSGDGRPRPPRTAQQVPSIEVERRPLTSYEAVLAPGGGR